MNRSGPASAAKPGAILRALLLSMLLLPGALAAQTDLRLRAGREAAILGAGMVLHGAGQWQHLQHRAPVRITVDPLRLPGIDRGVVGHWGAPSNQASNILFGAVTAASLATVLINQHGQRPLEPVAIVAESVLLTSGLTNTVKEIARRPRPYLYDPGGPRTVDASGGDLLSFWSGHTANMASITFSTAYIVQRSDASPALKTTTWIAAALAPAAMGYLRVRAARHFPTDVLAGYAVGAAVGILVPYLHRPLEKR